MLYAAIDNWIPELHQNVIVITFPSHELAINRLLQQMKQ